MVHWLPTTGRTRLVAYDDDLWILVSKCGLPYPEEFILFGVYEDLRVE